MGIVGLVMPLVLLPFVGIVSAIAIPALLGQKARVRDRQAIANLNAGLAGLVAQYDELKAGNKTDPEIKAALDAFLKENGRTGKNPWSPANPAFSYSIAVVDGITSGTTGGEGTLPPGELGQCVYAIQFSTKERPGYLAGSVRITNAVNGSPVYFRKMAIE
jgi:hypothetical protein